MSLNAIEGFTHPNTIPVNRRRAFGFIVLAALVVDALTVRSIVLLAPAIRTQMGIDERQFGYIFGAFMLGTLLTTLPVGRLLVRVPTRVAYSSLLSLVAAGLFLVSYQSTFNRLLISIFILGVCRAGIIPLANQVITENFTSNQRGLSTGLIFGAVPLGGFVGALVLPAVAEAFSWSAGYRLLGSLALLTAILTWSLLPKNDLPKPPATASIRSSLLLSSTFIALSVAYGLFAFGMAAETYVTLYLVDVVKTSTFVAGAFFGLIQLFGIVARLFWGALADRFFQNNRWWLLAATSALLVVSLTLLIQLSPASSKLFVSLVMLCFGFSAASAWVILCTLVGDIVEIQSVATGTAIIFFITNITDATGPVLFGNILKASGSYHNPLAFYAIFPAAAMLIFISMALWQRKSTG